MLQYHFNWKALSAIAGVTYWRFYFRLFPGAIKSEQIIEFLDALKRQIGKSLLVVWDGLAAHRSRKVRDYVDSLDGAIQLERLPAYAPELNPVEYVWGYLKTHELSNFCARAPPPVFDATPTDIGRGVLETGRVILSMSHLFTKASIIDGDSANPIAAA